jgi:hypothetical protein
MRRLHNIDFNVRWYVNGAGNKLREFIFKYLENMDLNTAEKRHLYWFFGTTNKKLTTSVILFYV